MSGPSWIDLSAVQQHQTMQADICVIGAGAAGIYLAVQLAKLGLSVVILEAGPVSSTDVADIGFVPVFEESVYPGATLGRFFGMGGSTSRWGGALVPHTAYDIRPAGAFEKEWSHIVGVVSDKAREVLRSLGYCADAQFDLFAECSLGQPIRTLADCGIHTQAALYLPFRRKNLVSLLDKAKAWKIAPKVYFNAVAKEWVVVPGKHSESRIVMVGAVSRNNNRLTVSADKFVLAAGAIECARILLELNESMAQPVLRRSALPGCYLADHLSLAVANVTWQDFRLTAHMFAPRFSGGWMRNFRFLEKNPPRDAPRSFAHFIFANRSKGFELAKKVLSSMQMRRWPSGTLADVASGLGDLTKLAYHRFIRSQLYIPPQTAVHLQLDIEQEPVRENRIRLSPSKDEYGRYVAIIRWQITNRDIANLIDTAHRFLAKWPGSAVGLPVLKPITIDFKCAKPHDAYHPVGTCRMGNDLESVVDYNLKVWGVENLWVTSTGVLPSAGTANPTFSILCLTHKLAEHLRSIH